MKGTKCLVFTREKGTAPPSLGGSPASTGRSGEWRAPPRLVLAPPCVLSRRALGGRGRKGQGARLSRQPATGQHQLEARYSAQEQLQVTPGD